MPRSFTERGCIVPRVLNLSYRGMSPDSCHLRFKPSPPRHPLKISRCVLLLWGRKKSLQFPGIEFQFPYSATRRMFIVPTDDCVSAQQYTKANFICDSNCELVRVLVMCMLYHKRSFYKARQYKN